MEFGWLSLLPAMVTIIVALSLKRVSLALFLGVVGGAIVVSGFSLFEAPGYLWVYLRDAFTDPERLSIVLFILLIGALLELIALSGGYIAFADHLGKRLNSGKKSRIATWGISMCLFFDDYANVLISGASMRNINMRNGVSPALLAYIVDVVAIMASIMIISTWAAFEGAVMVDAAEAIGKEGTLTTLFLQSLPYHFYTFLAISLALVVAISGKWFAWRLDNKRYKAPEASLQQQQGKPAFVVAPVLTLIGFALVALFVSGTYILLQNNEPLTLISILGSAPAVEILIFGTVLAILVLLVMMHKHRKTRGRSVAQGMFRGMKGMVDVSLVIFMATALAAASSDLGTGIYISRSFSSFIDPQMIPALIYVMAMLITVSTGFSWSSMAIVMPIAYQMVAAEGMPELIPVVSAAVITGAVAGEHMIPWSEKAVMTAAACKITPLYHIRTQILQSITAFSGGLISFLVIGRGTTAAIAVMAGLAFVLTAHFVFAKKAVMKRS